MIESTSSLPTLGQLKLAQVVDEFFEPIAQDARLLLLASATDIGEATQASLHRAAIVMSVAAWQAYVEALARALLELGSPAHRVSKEALNDPVVQLLLRTGEASHQLLKRNVEKHITRFNTPSAANSKELLSLVGLEPGWSTRENDRELDYFVTIRHAIAHGRKTRVTGASPKPTWEQATRCVTVFRLAVDAALVHAQALHQD